MFRLKTCLPRRIICIGRKRKVIIPNGEDHLEVGDSVIVITKDHIINEFSDILA